MHPCEEALSLLSLQLDGALSPSEEQVLTAHLNHCPHCRQVAEDLQAIHTAMPTEVPCPQGLHQRMMEAIEADAQTNNQPQLVALPQKQHNRWKSWLAMAAVFALICTAGLSLPPSTEDASSAPMTMTADYDTPVPSTEAMIRDATPEETATTTETTTETTMEASSDTTADLSPSQESLSCLPAENGFAWLAEAGLSEGLSGDYDLNTLGSADLERVIPLEGQAVFLDEQDWLVTYYDSQQLPVYHLVCDSQTSQVLGNLPIN